MKPVVVFDLDDTLFRERDFVRSGFDALDAWLRAKRGVDGFGTVAWRIFSEGGRNTVFDRALSELRVDGADAVVPELVKVYRAHRPSIVLFPDAEWALERYGAVSSLGLLTDGYLETQKNKVTALGIASRFAAIVYTDSLGRAHWKPSPAPFRELMERLPSPGGYAYVGDNPAKDFVAPKGLGWTTVQVRRGGGEYGEDGADIPESHRADRVIPSLRELPDALGF